MSKERLSELLTELNRELRTADDIDDETRELLRQMNDDLDRLTGENYFTGEEAAAICCESPSCRAHRQRTR